MDRLLSPRLLSALVVSAMVSACGPTVPPIPYRDVLDSWVGHDANELIRKRGAPTQTMTMPNGNRLLIYREDDSYYTPPLPALGVPSQSVNMSCQTEFEIDRAARIIRWRYQGQLCPK
jgi:hypothetical protein